MKTYLAPVDNARIARMIRHVSIDTIRLISDVGLEPTAYDRYLLLRNRRLTT